MSPAECGFGYRTSVFKREPDRFVVLTVHFRLKADPASAPVRYAELARSPRSDVGSSAPLAEVRARRPGAARSKGMVLDADDHDTWSAGSFFTNPILEAGDACRLTHPAGSSRTVASRRRPHG